MFIACDRNIHRTGSSITEGEGIFQKPYKSLLGEEFRDNLAETIKAKKYTIKAMTEVNRLNS